MRCSAPCCPRPCRHRPPGPPPPRTWPRAVVGAECGVCYVESAAGPPVGVAEPPSELVELQVPENGLLALYTDGLIESAPVDSDAGMRRLAELLQTHNGESLDQL